MRDMTLSFEKPDEICQFLIHGGQALGKSMQRVTSKLGGVARWQQKEREL